MKVECLWCSAEAANFYVYTIHGKSKVTARCRDHKCYIINWDKITKEDYLAHKAMEVL